MSAKEFTPITTQEQLNEIIKVRLNRQKSKRDEEVALLKQQVLKAQNLLITQEQMLDAIRVIVREELNTLTGGK